MAEEKGKKSAAAPKAKPQARQPGVGGVGSNPTTTGPARLYGDAGPEPPSASPAPPKGHSKRGERPSPKPAPKSGAAPSGEADVKPRESVAKGSKTPAVRTTKPKA